MIIDSLDRLKEYEALNPLFPRVVKFIQETDLNTLPLGVTAIEGDDLFVNIQQTQPKSREQSKMETHAKMIDIQIPISADEEQGFLACSRVTPAVMDEAKDIAFHANIPDNYITVHVGEFAIYFPGEGHCPGIAPNGLKKAIFKIKA